jgi:hypothetical protein
MNLYVRNTRVNKLKMLIFSLLSIYTINGVKQFENSEIIRIKQRKDIHHAKYIVTCLVVHSSKMTGSISDDWIY